MPRRPAGELTQNTDDCWAGTPWAKKASAPEVVEIPNESADFWAGTLWARNNTNSNTPPQKESADFWRGTVWSRNSTSAQASDDRRAEVSSAVRSLLGAGVEDHRQSKGRNGPGGMWEGTMWAKNAAPGSTAPPDREVQGRSKLRAGASALGAGVHDYNSYSHGAPNRAMQSAPPPYFPNPVESPEHGAGVLFDRPPRIPSDINGGSLPTILSPPEAAELEDAERALPSVIHLSPEPVKDTKINNRAPIAIDAQYYLQYLEKRGKKSVQNSSQVTRETNQLQAERNATGFQQRNLQSGPLDSPTGSTGTSSSGPMSPKPPSPKPPGQPRRPAAPPQKSSRGPAGRSPRIRSPPSSSSTNDSPNQASPPDRAPVRRGPWRLADNEGHRQWVREEGGADGGDNDGGDS